MDAPTLQEDADSERLKMLGDLVNDYLNAGKEDSTGFAIIVFTAGDILTGRTRLDFISNVSTQLMLIAIRAFLQGAEPKANVSTQIQ